MAKNYIELTEEEYLQHCNDYDGVCLACHEIKYGMTEPDAENYECDECGEYKVMGMEQALFCGNIEIV